MESTFTQRQPRSRACQSVDFHWRKASGVAMRVQRVCDDSEGAAGRHVLHFGFVAKKKEENTRATTAYAEQTTVAAFLPWRGS